MAQFTLCFLGWLVCGCGSSTGSPESPHRPEGVQARTATMASQPAPSEAFARTTDTFGSGESGTETDRDAKVQAGNAVPGAADRTEWKSERLEQTPFLADVSSGVRVLAQPLRLLKSPAVQRELELSEEQRENVNGALTHREQQQIGMFRLRREISAEEMRAKVDETDTSALEEITETLNEEQRLRLKEIRLQVLSYWGLSTPEVSENLKLSKQQTEQIQQAFRDLALARRELQQNRSENTEKTKRHLKELQGHLIRKIDRVLTEKQQDQWREMLGKPFDLRLLYRKGQGSTIKDLEDRKDRKLDGEGN